MEFGPEQIFLILFFFLKSFLRAQTFFHPGAFLSDVSVQYLRSKVDQFLTLKEIIKEKESELSDLQKRLQPISFELNEIMEAMDLTRFDGSKGKITRHVIDYVSNPQTDEDKKAFSDYLKSIGMYEDLSSVHHQRLNSFYKDQLAMAIEEGRELNIPGLEPKQRVEIRKGR